MRTVGFAAAVLAAACTSGTDDAIRDLDGRLSALERRGVERTPAPPAPASEGDPDRLDADLRSLERRLAAVEADVAALAAAAEAGDLGDAAAGAARRKRRDERRGRLRDLTAEYRGKLAELRRQYRDDPTDPARQRALRDVVDWYRAERRAVMRDG